MKKTDERTLHFNPVSGELRFDVSYSTPDNIPDSIHWPMDAQRSNKPFGFKNLTLALTMKCNLACDYCWQHRSNIPDMSRETIDYWLDFFLDSEKNNPNKILYYGGEPLLRMDLIEHASRQMTQICENRGIPRVHQHIFTNATMLTEANLEILQREGVYLILSIDGNPQVNAAHRHTSDNVSMFDQIAEGICRLHQRGMKFGVCCTLSEPDFDPDITVRYILEEIQPESIELNLRHDAAFCEKAQKFKNQKLTHFYDAWDLIRSRNTVNIDLRKRLEAIASQIPLQNSSSGSKNKLSVMPNGMISSFNGAVSFPALQIRPEGNWIDQFRARWDRNILTEKKCQQCHAAFICGQGSAFSSYLQHRDFNHTPALHCEYCRSMLDYIINKIRDTLLSSKEIPYGYTVSDKDIREVFPMMKRNG